MAWAGTPGSLGPVTSCQPHPSSGGLRQPLWLLCCLHSLLNHIVAHFCTASSWHVAEDCEGPCEDGYHQRQCARKTAEPGRWLLGFSSLTQTRIRDPLICLIFSLAPIPSLASPPSLFLHLLPLQTAVDCPHHHGHQTLCIPFTPLSFCMHCCQSLMPVTFSRALSLKY